MRQLRQPRLAEIVAARLRDDILAGRLTEGDSLPRQEHLFTEFRVSLPAVREAMRILETEGLISVRRGNVGGAVVHLPTPMRIARTISMVLQTRQTTMADVSGALLNLEPTCAALCAARPDRDETTVPALRAVIAEQQAAFDDPVQFPILARRFHEKLVDAIEAGDAERAVRLATAHLAATRKSSLGTADGDIVNTNLLDNLDLNGTR